MASSTRTGGREATSAVVPGRYALSIGEPPLPLPHGWAWTKLTNVARLESGHTPSRKRPEYWNGGVPWIGIKDATQNHGRLLADTFQHASELGIENSSARVLPKHTVCLSRTASVGYVVVMGQPMATSQDFVNWVCSDRLDWRFLKHVLLAEREALVRYAHGTTHQTIYFPEVKAFHVCLPHIDEQRSIVSVLGALADKVESNRLLGDTTWDVVAHEFRRSCPIVGGDGGTIASLATVVMGQAPPGSSYIEAPAEGALPMVQGNGGFGVRFAEPTVWTTSATKVVGPGTPLMTVRAPVGAVNQAASDLCLGRGVAGLVSTRPVLVECLLRELQRVDGWVAHESGTIYPSINRDQIAGLPIAPPSEPDADAFEEWATPMADQVRLLDREQRTLIAIRDALLPKLVSGQIRVPLSDDSEEQIGVATEALQAATGPLEPK